MSGRGIQESEFIPPQAPDAVSKRSLRAWLYLIKCSKELDQAMSERFRLYYQSSLSRFDVLAHLDLAGEQGLSTSVLAGKLLASKGNITRLLDRMEQDGLIIRHQHSHDKRVHHVCLSGKGAELFSKMAPDHERWAYEILSVLDSREQSELVRLLKTVRSRLEGVL